MTKTIINLPPDFAGQVVINHILGTTTITANAHQPAPSTPPGPSPTDNGSNYFAPAVEDLLKRHKKHSPQTRSREVAEVLRDRGWEVHEHKRYVRFIWAGKSLEVSLYLNSKDLLMKTNGHVIEGKEGTKSSGSGSRIPFNGDDFELALQVIEFLEAFAG